MRQSNEGKHETSVIGAIETFPDDLSKPFLLYSNNSKEKSPREEGDQNILSKSSVGKPTEKLLNSQTDCWLNDVSERRLDNGISPSERENHLLSFLHGNDGRWHEKHNWFVYWNPKLRLLFAQLLYFFHEEYEGAIENFEKAKIKSVDLNQDQEQGLQFFEKCVIAFATWCSSPTKNSILSFRFSQFSFFLFSHFVLINVVENPKIGKINDLVKKPLLSEVSDVEKLFVVIFWPNIEIERKKRCFFTFRQTKKGK